MHDELLFGVGFFTPGIKLDCDSRVRAQLWIEEERPEGVASRIDDGRC